MTRGHPFVAWRFSVIEWTEPSPDPDGVVRQTVKSEETVTAGCVVCSWPAQHPLHQGFRGDE